MHSALSIPYQSSPEEEAVFIHVEFARCLQDFGTHVETEQKLVTLKQPSTGVSANRSDMLGLMHKVALIWFKHINDVKNTGHEFLQK